MEILFKLLMCHFVGDYVLQNDFIAKTKGTNWWHLIVHCFLYSLPFYLAFGWTWQLGYMIATHIIIDSMKARYSKIDYFTVQLLHVAAFAAYLIR